MRDATLSVMYWLEVYGVLRKNGVSASEAIAVTSRMTTVKEEYVRRFKLIQLISLTLLGNFSQGFLWLFR
jgi:hypothetical protein